MFGVIYICYHGSVERNLLYAPLYQYTVSAQAATSFIIGCQVVIRATCSGCCQVEALIRTHPDRLTVSKARYTYVIYPGAPRSIPMGVTLVKNQHIPQPLLSHQDILRLASARSMPYLPHWWKNHQRLQSGSQVKTNPAL